MRKAYIETEKLKAILNGAVTIFQQMIDNSEHKTPNDYDKGYLNGIKHCLYIIDSMQEESYSVDVKRPVSTDHTSSGSENTNTFGNHINQRFSCCKQYRVSLYYIAGRDILQSKRLFQPGKAIRAKRRLFLRRSVQF